MPAITRSGLYVPRGWTASLRGVISGLVEKTQSNYARRFSNIDFSRMASMSPSDRASMLNGIIADGKADSKAVLKEGIHDFIGIVLNAEGKYFSELKSAEMYKDILKRVEAYMRKPFRGLIHKKSGEGYASKKAGMGVTYLERLNLQRRREVISLVTHTKHITDPAQLKAAILSQYTSYRNDARIIYSELVRARRQVVIEVATELELNVRYVLSTLPGRKPDICDWYASRNAYGLGRGVYPTNKVPEYPHPFCACSLAVVRD